MTDGRRHRQGDCADARRAGLACDCSGTRCGRDIPETQRLGHSELFTYEMDVTKRYPLPHVYM